MIAKQERKNMHSLMSSAHSHTEGRKMGRIGVFKGLTVRNVTVIQLDDFY